MTSTKSKTVSGRPSKSRQLPAHMRQHNRALVLRLLFREGEQSRAELARATGLSQVTVSDLVSELMEEGLVEEGGTRKTPGPGAPARSVRLVADSRNIVAVTISGGDQFEGAVFTLGGDVIARERVGRVSERGSDAVRLIEALVQRLLSQTNAPVLGIGVSSPGIIDRAGVVRVAANLGWSELALREILENATGLPVSLTNGANALALAELSLGQVDHDLLLVRVGSGLGVASIINGEVVHGRYSAAGELSHVVVTVGEGPVCACGRQGCLEAWLAEPSLRARLAASAPSERDSILRTAGGYLGQALAPVVVTLGLTDIAVSGPIDLIDGPLLDEVREALRARVLPLLYDDLEVRLAETADDTRLRGAMLLVLADRVGIS